MSRSKNRSKIFGVLLAAAVLAGVIANFSDIKRYIKISSM